MDISTVVLQPEETCDAVWSSKTQINKMIDNGMFIDVGCGEGRNSIFLTEHGHTVDAFDVSEAGIEKAKFIAVHKRLNISFFVCDLGEFVFEKEYDVILSQGVLHLPEKYKDWKMLSHEESTFSDSHPGGVSHEHAYERIVAQKQF